MTASVVICTLGEGSRLLEALDALRPQLPPRAEVILVRSGTAEHAPISDGLRRWIEDAPCPVRVVGDPRPGVARARNVGIREATSETVVFLDDDALPRPGWLDNLVLKMADPHVGVAAGSIVPCWPNGDRPPWLTTDLSVGYFGARDAGRTNVPPFGANMAMRRSAVMEVGGFRTELGPIGKKPGAHEEAELVRRLTDAGYKLVEVPEAVVEHLISRDQLRLQWVLRRAWAIGMSDATQDWIRGTLRPRKRSKRLLNAPGRLIQGHNRRRIEVLARAVTDFAYLVRSVRYAKPPREP